MQRDPETNEITGRKDDLMPKMKNEKETPMIKRILSKFSSDLSRQQENQYFAVSKPAEGYTFYGMNLIDFTFFFNLFFFQTDGCKIGYSPKPLFDPERERNKADPFYKEEQRPEYQESKFYTVKTKRDCDDDDMGAEM